MEKFTQKQLRALVASGAVVDLTHALDYSGAKLQSGENLIQIGYAAGVYGCNGKLLQASGSGKLYAITSRTQAIYIF